MNASRINLGLRTIAVLLAAASCAIIGVGLFLPLEDAMAPTQIGISTTQRTKGPRLPSIDSFTPIFSRSMQPASTIAAAASQTDTPPPEAAAVIAQITLVGTIGESIALLRGPDGTVQLTEIGDDVMGAPVLAIRPSQCDLRIGGKLKTLRIAPPPEDHSVTTVNTAAK